MFLLLKGKSLNCQEVRLQSTLPIPSIAMLEKMYGAKINNQNAPLDTKLKNGDVVSVLQHPNAKPDPSWLNFVRTSKARAAIRNTLKKRLASE